ncbi:PREDICTED: intraflagellar transport protein 56 [Cyprinodon variegatus]|uniref:intraflagellar transport protein 56 n=1 Tax=Cyprinodon variegatus TaxID=28743 RepID=UPI0007428EE0|nr:PREDICTED: intraflagellar transport protein 56 [Cyprinodon variegatus]
MILSRVKPAVGAETEGSIGEKKKKQTVPSLEEYLQQRDYLGGLTLLEVINTSHCFSVTPMSPLQNRLLFHLAHKFNDEKRLMRFHQNLEDVTEDQLSLASIHYMRSHYQEAIDIYKRLLLQNRQALISHSSHTQLTHAELKNLIDISSCSSEFAKEVIQHNLVVFRGGEGALQVLPPLIDVIPEARLNLVIYYLRQASQNIVDDSFLLQVYILKGVVNAAVGQKIGSRDHLKVAQQFFQLVGGSASECDTIPGRQCMASCFFLLRQFEDALVYLNSVKSYFYNDDTFNFNYAQATAAQGQYKEAEECFLLIQDENIKNDYVYLSWLARCCEYRSTIGGGTL